jgi:hypothetical protein
MIPCGGFTTPMRQLPHFFAITRGRLFLIWMLQYMKDAIRWHLDYRKTILLD